MSSYPAYYAGGYQRSSMDAYRASPVQHRGGRGGGGGGGSSGGAAARSYGFGPGPAYSEPYYGAELYGFEHAVGLPGFEGTVASATVAAGGPLAAASNPAAAEARYLAQLCHEALADFRQQHAWAADVTPAVETALRTLALYATPSQRELQLRLQAMGRLKELAQSGIHFCVGLDLEPYGSFVSGLYTPQGDLDLSIEGQATWRDEAGQVQRVTVDGMERDMKVKFLRALSNRIQAKRLCLGQVDRILHARVPILKFRDLSGLDFDVGIGGSQALFKSTILGLLAQFDWRVGALVRLVKLWARHHDVNDSTNGTLNSFALTLLVVFHLQTRSPAVLPPLCELFGSGPGDERPMQEQRFPNWRLLQVACDRLSHLSRLGGPGVAAGHSGGNSETLLELLASFFALYEGLLTGGWAASKGADAPAMRSVLRRVRVDTWAGRLRYERWDRDDYCMSIEDPFDSTDNCARTVRKEDKADRIRSAVQTGRDVLLDLRAPGIAERALGALFGRGGLHPRQLAELLYDREAPAVQWIRPVDLIIPPRIQAHTEGRIPRTVHVNHQRPRGGGAAAAQQHEVAHVTQQLQQMELYSFGPAPLPPPPPGIGLPPGMPMPGMPGFPPAAPAQQRQQQQAPPPLASLHELRALMDGSVSEEAARIAEVERTAAEAAAAQQAARKEKREAKKALQKAQQEAKRAERQRLRAERGRSRSRSRASSRSGSRRSSRSRSASLAAAHAAAAVAVSNLSSASSLATTVTESVTAVSVSTVEPAVAGSTAAAAAQVAEVEVAVLAAAASDGAGSASGSVAAAAAPGPLAAVLAADAAAASDGGGSASSGSGRKKEKRFGKNMKTAAKERQQRRASSAAAGEAGSGAANGAAALPPPPPGLAPAAPLQKQQQQQQAQQPQREQQPAGPKDGKRQRQQNRPRGGRGGGRGGGRPEGEAAAPAARVLTVPRPGSGAGSVPPVQT